MAHLSPKKIPKISFCGAESVDMVIRAEHAFKIRIEDGEAEKVMTPGQFIDLIYSKVGGKSGGICPTQHIFYKLRKLLSERFSLKKTEIALETDIRSFCVPKDQIYLWNFLQEEIPSLRLIEPVRSFWVKFCLFFLLAGIGLTLFIQQDWPIFFAIVGSISVWLTALFLTKPFKTRIPFSFRTPRQLVSHIVSIEAKGQMPQQKGWSRGQIADVVKTIAMEELAPDPEKYSEDANFIDDLGLVD